MTRETKIGLLVGLAFIIVIGILLSDHMTSATEPPKAPLSVAGNNLRESVVTPGGSNGAPPVAAVGGAPAAVAPNQTVMTGGDLSQPPARTPVPTIQVGPGAAPAQPPVVVQQGPAVQLQPQIPVQITQAPAQQSAQQAAQQVAPPVVIAPPANSPQSGHPLQPLAMRHGEEIVPVGEAGTASARPQPVPMGQLREYKAQSGDSLSKLAARFMGSASKANREAIIRVNPTLQQNPDKIIEGRTYVLPPPPAPAADVASATTPAAPAQTPAPTPAPAAPSARGQTPAQQPTARTPETTTAADNFSWYTVKENENLWKIASEQLGSGNAWTQIRDLNQDILKGEDQVRSNTRIRIPNKPVASAAH
jgi:nucleoid-associated protein YgaU